MNDTLQIKNRIINSKKNAIFITSDFTDISSFDTCNRILNRLIDEGVLSRVMRGVYYKARYLDFIGVYSSPDLDLVANAIARKFKWSIVPEGNFGMNVLGLSTQVPAHYIYMSNGPSRIYKYKNATITFIRCCKKDIVGLSRKSALLVQTLKTIGNNKVEDWMVKKISNILSEKEKELILRETRNITSWVYNYIKIICK